MGQSDNFKADEENITDPDRAPAPCIESNCPDETKVIKPQKLQERFQQYNE